jgi:type IV pilus assembly protein PilO
MQEKFLNLQLRYQVILMAAFAALIFAGFSQTFTASTRAEASSIESEAEQKSAQNQAAREATAQFDEIRASLAERSVEYDELKSLLPEQREITNVLKGLQDTARDSRLSVMRFSPREDVQQGSITAKPVEVEVESNFNNLREFFDRMAKLQRIVSITDFKLNQISKPSSGRTLNAQFLLTAYYATPENLNGTKPAQPAATAAPAK